VHYNMVVWVLYYFIFKLYIHKKVIYLFKAGHFLLHDK
jgi:hypothetical protein